MLFEYDYDTYIKAYVRNMFEKITVNPGACRYNYKCHLNSVHEAIENKQKRVAVVWYIEDNEKVIVHFLNVDENWIFTDNTLWHWSKYIEYYLIEYIDEGRFPQIWNVLMQYKEFLWGQSPWYMRLFVAKYRN